VRLTAWQRFEVVLTGAFLTGQPMHVTISDYSQLQRKLGEELKNHASGGWDYEGVKWRDVGSYDTGGGYTSLVPLVLVRREGEVLAAALKKAQEQRPEPEQSWFMKVMQGWTWELRELRIELYDLGVGVIKGVYEVVVPASHSAADARRDIESLCWLRPNALSRVRSPIAESYETVTRETVRVFGDAATRHAKDDCQQPWMTPLLAALPPRERGSSSSCTDQANKTEHDNEWGRLLWLHPVYVLASSPRAGSIQLGFIARPFRATFSQSVKYPGGLLVPGIDSSVVVVRGSIRRQQEIPMKLIGLMWAYYALFMEMDRGLLAMLDNNRWNKSAPLGRLERDAEWMFALNMRVQEARARLESALTDLGGGELSLWDVIAEVDKFGDLVSAVEGKVQALQRIAERRAQQAAVVRARRTSNILSGLTALTVITVAIAVLTNFIGTPADAISHFDLRLGVVSFALALALIIFIAVHFEFAGWPAGRWRLTRKGHTELDKWSRFPVEDDPGKASRWWSSRLGRVDQAPALRSTGPESAGPLSIHS
jgi:hypothetical protein